jgi:hypothetical protein
MAPPPTAAPGGRRPPAPPRAQPPGFVPFSIGRTVPFSTGIDTADEAIRPPLQPGPSRHCEEAAQRPTKQSGNPGSQARGRLLRARASPGSLAMTRGQAPPGALAMTGTPGCARGARNDEGPTRHQAEARAPPPVIARRPRSGRRSNPAAPAARPHPSLRGGRAAADEAIPQPWQPARGRLLRARASPGSLAMTRGQAPPGSLAMTRGQAPPGALAMTGTPGSARGARNDRNAGLRPGRSR